MLKDIFNWLKDVDTNLLFSIITAIIGVVALIQSSIQIRINNKQRLFDRRINNYLITGVVNFMI